ncbi:AmmeMemoRadiSam system radical SAM enzyme [Streptoalloteichus hindustanus]|uniref:Pyruvate formate lyase activating enzyme n=1 Tax=Streptoalloteichus hindustanus TaxID=2017 RepID=A0A1M4ZCU0_STRHI|nr:AmmeMemoRadiSam system radical SAM enzyme [Streptoalloteichus hindustanus]SHF15831.1 pyruvate formate lyase activating enzyme [Streptoalloteichus hindustanus]
MVNWKEDPYPARLAEELPDGVVRCLLSPRHCRIRPGQHGFCMVRANRDGRLVSLNYGRSVHATEETIETEAVFHYAPGEPILSMGNIGCMLNCDYCHNWKTSQARFVSDDDIHRYTPDEVVEIALRHGIRVLSWTYNDPVVWHEFVTETAALARKAGLVNLFKSAFFISPEAVAELLPVIDIFSISVKSMDPRYYRRLTKGWLEPVLDGARQVHRAGRHVEISTLMVTDLSDDEKTARAVARFVGEELDPAVPLHFVRFHPDYKMTNSRRTPLDRLEHARRVALDMGIHHVYLGNVYDTDATVTTCHWCGHRQVTRYGLNASVVGVGADGTCGGCGKPANLTLLPARPARATLAELPTGQHLRTAGFHWHGDVRSLHIQVRNDSDSARTLYQRRFGTDCAPAWTPLNLLPGESYRFIAAKATPGEQGVEVAVSDDVRCSLHEVFDRAHFPTVETSAGSLNDDVTPLPSYDAAVGRPLPVLDVEGSTR